MHGQALAALREQLAAKRAEAVAAFRANLRPDTLLASLRRITDQTLRELVRLHPLPPGSTLVAVGGYGRVELYPYSDVDILVLLRDPPSRKETAMIEALVASMWDLGIELVHSVRTLDDCRRDSANDITVETALMDARWQDGSQSRLQKL